MPTQMQTVSTSSDYHVLASDWLVFNDQNAFMLSQANAQSAANLRISGEVDALQTNDDPGSPGLVGVLVANVYSLAPTVSLDPGAILKVSTSKAGAVAHGYYATNTGGPSLANAGTIIVEAPGAATGVFNIASLGALNNSGQLTVTSASANAVGARVTSYGAQVTNSGSITVTGHGEVIGVDMGTSGSNQAFRNTGAITAHDDSASTASVGVFWGNAAQPGQPAAFVNDGWIEADTALEVDIGHGAAAENLFINNGHLVGAVWLGGGAAETLVNNGVITGPIKLIGMGSIYDGRLGTALGPISSLFTGGVTILGGAGAETMTGGMYQDSLSGGAGGDLLDGGDGSNTMFGGDGDDTITGGLGFDQVNGNLGADSIVGRSETGDWLLGGQGDDAIDASASVGANIVNGNLGVDTLVGGRGPDTLRGGQGDDIIHVGPGGAWVSGDLGRNTIYGGQGADTFHASAGHDDIIGWNAGDRIQVDHGVTWTVTQADTGVRISFSNGGEIDLLGAQQSSLQPGWIVTS